MAHTDNKEEIENIMPTDENPIKIINGDCLEVMKQIPDNSIDLVLTDPPYCFEAHGSGFVGERQSLFGGLKSIGVDKDKNFITSGLLKELMRVCKEKNIFIFCNKAQILDMLIFARDNNCYVDIIPFCKNTPMPLSNNQWLPDREWGIHISRDCEVKGDYSVKKGFFIDNNYKQDDFEHPSVKPEYMIRRLLKNLSINGSIVLDCFLGSGTTAVACKQLGRKCIGIEISKEYCDIAKKRLQQEVLI